MKYSFLVPVYNVEKYLTQCMESMLSQTYKDFEIILVDDGSTDNSGKICDEYSEKYPEIVKVIHKKNEGHTSARQVAIKNATGEICVFVDSDDFVENNLLEKVNNEFTNEKDLDMVIYSFCYNNNGVKTARKNQFFNDNRLFCETQKKEIYKALMFSSSINALWVKAIKSYIIKNDPTDYALYYDKLLAEDQFQSIYLVTASKKIKYINMALYNYRTDNISISRSFDAEYINKKNMLYVYDKFVEMLPEWNMNHDDVIDRLKAQWLNLTVYTFNQYYNAAGTYYQRKKVVDFDWDSMLPENSEKSKFNSEATLEVYELIRNKKYAALYMRYMKNKAYKVLKKVKAGITNDTQ